MPERKANIQIVAPALRVLFAKEGRLAKVTHHSERLADATEVSVEGDFSPESIRQVVGGLEATAIHIPHLGSFAIAHPEGSGRVAGKVAFVTGAAQGFGAGIAEGLAQEGAFVVVADMNVDGARSTANRINQTVGKELCIGVEVNVTDTDSVARAIHETVLNFGGLDLLMSNAGVLKAGSVKTQPEKDFEFVTKVNYMGYFLVVKHAAPVMGVQHATDSNLWTDIIQINSKSGLEGSNKNGAYAGSKFGGIGLTQSFALELIGDGIKVNSICPGNFFDGPLWSDPENGLFAQYLRAGKVPNAKTTDDVRHFYESKVPMGRGCTVPDVLRAIFYLIEQQYETGQALPVTGGQVMLN